MSKSLDALRRQHDAAIERLQHADKPDRPAGECRGNWRLVGTDPNRVVRCDRCGASYPASPENRLAAIDEYYAGIYLRRMTRDGASMLDTDGAAWW